MHKSVEIEYAEMKEFLVFFSERYFRAEGLAPEEQPVAILEALEKKNVQLALRGLRQAVNDCVEVSFNFHHSEVEKLDSQLRSRAIVTLSELRRRYSKSYARLVKRGRIKNETEYYLIRNVLDDRTEKASGERELLEKMLSEYEEA